MNRIRSSASCLLMALLLSVACGDDAAQPAAGRRADAGRVAAAGSGGTGGRTVAADGGAGGVSGAGTAAVAGAAGVAVADAGPAELPCETRGSCERGKTCGGFAALQCDTGDFCNYAAASGGQGCDGHTADAAGACELQPASCPVTTPAPAAACGCDRHSYDSDCATHLAGVSVLHAGMCTTSDCLYLGGRPVAGSGAAPMCAADEMAVTAIVEDDGSTPVEGDGKGKICCLKR